MISDRDESTGTPEECRGHRLTQTKLDHGDEKTGVRRTGERAEEEVEGQSVRF